jgi:hypothetical protein
MRKAFTELLERQELIQKLVNKGWGLEIEYIGFHWWDFPLELIPTLCYI